MAGKGAQEAQDAQAHAAMQKRRRKEEAERRKRVSAAYAEQVARRDAHREAGYPEAELPEPERSPLDAVADMETD